MNEEMEQILMRRFREYVVNNQEIVFRQRVRGGRGNEKIGLEQRDRFTPSQLQFNEGNTVNVSGICEIYFPVDNDYISNGQANFQAQFRYTVINPDEEHDNFDFAIQEVINNQIDVQ